MLSFNFNNVFVTIALYIAISGLTSLKKKNLWISYAILFGFGIAAYVANIILDYNYMFLMNHDGTPYVIVYHLVKVNPLPIVKISDIKIFKVL